MSSKSLLIDLALQDTCCTVISPWYEYTRDEFGVVDGKVPRSEASTLELEQTVSASMQRLYQASLAETLEQEPPILYIDCGENPDDDVMFCICKAALERGVWENKAEVVSKIIGQRTIVVESREERDKYVQLNQPTREAMLEQYRSLLNARLKWGDATFRDILLKFESDIAFEALAKYMESINTKYLYLYMDNVQHLSVAEQSCINTFLYGRWGIQRDKRVRVKINNGNKQRKTRTASNGHRVESTHDYRESHISEQDLVG